MKRHILILFSFCFITLPLVHLQAQDWAAKKLELGLLQSTTVADQGALYVYYSHRLTSFNGPDSEFFKWENHNANLKLVYGIWDGLQLGLSWEAWRDTYGGTAKMEVMKQSDGATLDVSAYGGIFLNGELSKERYPFMKEADRLSYTSQIILGKHFSEKFFAEVAPTFIRQNLVWEKTQNHNQFAIGLGASYFLAEQVSVYFDYAAHFNRNETTVFKDPFTIGMDFNINFFTLGFSVSNTQALNDPSFISNGEGDWTEGNVFLGLNFVKVFK